MANFFDYFKDVSLRNGKIHFALTDTDIAIDRSFLHDVRAVSKFYIYFAFRRILRLFKRQKPAGTIAFFPHEPGPWYNLWQITRLANLRTQRDVQSADNIIVFEDTTYAETKIDVSKNPDAIWVNKDAADISKEHVADVFEQVFGYNLRIDPLTHQGKAIRKSNHNGKHDGIEIDCPIDAAELKDDQTYQRLVDSTFNGKTSEDLRITYAYGEIAVVYHKHKPLDDRFGTHYLSVDVLDPNTVFSADEIDLIKQFCAGMKLDLGAVDIMRDKNDRRIYIVDVNKTCMPVMCLPLKTQIECQQKVADALMAGLKKQMPA